ncbi:NIP3-like protein [Aphelenchoides bicaudatus]|nr:NIP3-like protein [Aphelenchoides bicaudatus]
MSFFERQPPLFDTKKRLGNLQSASSTERVQQQQSDEADSQTGLTESWVELAPSRASLCSSVEAVMVDRDNGDTSSGMNKDSRLSPVSVQSPHVEFESNFDQVKYQLVKDMLPPGKSTDWIWDWSSRPENVAPNRFLRNRNGQVGSALTTPPNSPEPDMSSEFELKHGGKVKKSIFYRFEVIIGLFVSNLVTFMIGATIGYWICKRIRHSGDTF